MGVPRGWKLRAVAGEATNFNVSAFVVPEGMPVADHGRQMSMWPVDPREFLELARLQAEALQEALALHRELVQHLIGADPPDVPKRAHQPQNKELRSWRPFRTYFQGLERTVRRDHCLKPTDTVTREMIYAEGGPHPRTTTRIMVETHHLRADQWPPSTWPEEPPQPA